jgi:hypothetical protein
MKLLKLFTTIGKRMCTESALRRTEQQQQFWLHQCRWKQCSTNYNCQCSADKQFPFFLMQYQEPWGPLFNVVDKHRALLGIVFTVSKKHSSCATSHFVNQFSPQPCNSRLIKYSLLE